MTTTTTGTFYVNKDRPGRPAISEHTSDAGEFVLKMRLVDNQGPRTSLLGADALERLADVGGDGRRVAKPAVDEAADGAGLLRLLGAPRARGNDHDHGVLQP